MHYSEEREEDARKALSPPRKVVGTRRGVFALPARAVLEKQWFVTRVMGLCAILKAESLVLHDVIEYHAISDLFDVVERGQITPNYDISIADNGEVTAKKRGG